MPKHMNSASIADKFSYRITSDNGEESLDVFLKEFKELLDIFKNPTVSVENEDWFCPKNVAFTQEKNQLCLKLIDPGTGKSKRFLIWMDSPEKASTLAQFLELYLKPYQIKKVDVSTPDLHSAPTGQALCNHRLPAVTAVVYLGTTALEARQHSRGRGNLGSND